MLHGDFNARVVNLVEMDDGIGVFGEDVCIANGNRLLSIL